MSNEFTDYGLTINSISENITEIQTALQEAFSNTNLTVEDNENLGHWVKVFAGRETKVWQAINQVVNIWTLNGCEGSFLDEIFALNGVFRESATSGSGDAVVQTDNSAVDSTPFSAGTIFSSENGIQYAVATEQYVYQRVTAYKVDGADASLGSYTFTIINSETSEESTFTVTLASSTNSSRLTFLQGLKTRLQAVNPNEENIYLDEDNLILYWGFDEAYDLVGIEQTVSMQIDTTLGNRYSLVECVAATTGYHPNLPSQISSMSPLPVGYLSVTNLTSFTTGSEVETDAAFIERARQISDSPRSATRNAVVSGVLTSVPDVEEIIILKEVVNGVVEVTPVVIGGETSDIAQALYEKQPISCTFKGTTSYSVDTDDNRTEEIFFERGVQSDLAVRVTYTTTNGKALSETEELEAASNMTDLSEEWSIGNTIFNFTLLSAVSNAADTNRFSSLLVETKLSTAPDSEYSSSNYITTASELPTLSATNINFVKSS